MYGVEMSVMSANAASFCQPWRCVYRLWLILVVLSLETYPTEFARFRLLLRECAFGCYYSLMPASNATPARSSTARLSIRIIYC
jgi:hypothetical protein